MFVVRNSGKVDASSDLFIYLPIMITLRLELGVNLLKHDISLYVRASNTQLPTRLITSASSNLVTSWETTAPQFADAQVIQLVEFKDQLYSWQMLDLVNQAYKIGFETSLSLTNSISSLGTFNQNFGLVTTQIQGQTGNTTVQLSLINSIGQIFPNLLGSVQYLNTHAVPSVISATYKVFSF